MEASGNKKCINEVFPFKKTKRFYYININYET